MSGWAENSLLRFGNVKKERRARIKRISVYTTSCLCRIHCCLVRLSSTAYRENVAEIDYMILIFMLDKKFQFSTTLCDPDAVDRKRLSDTSIMQNNQANFPTKRRRCSETTTISKMSWNNSFGIRSEINYWMANIWLHISKINAVTKNVQILIIEYLQYILSKSCAYVS